MDYYLTDGGELYHYGVKGQKWGVRRYQNKDGSLTPAGKKRYGLGDNGELVKKSSTTRILEGLAKSGYKNAKTQQTLYEQFGDEYNRRSSEQWIREADQNSKQAKRSFELDKIANTDKKTAKLLRKGQFGANQNAVLLQRIDALSKDKVFSEKWDAAFKAGKGSKEWAAFKKYTDDFNEKYKNQYVNAWMKDNNVKRLSDQGRKYLEDSFNV